MTKLKLKISRYFSLINISVNLLAADWQTEKAHIQTKIFPKAANINLYLIINSINIFQR